MKALYPIDVTESGRLMPVRAVQPMKASFSIVVTVSGISTAFREPQRANALALIVLTPALIVTVSRAEHPVNSPCDSFLHLTSAASREVHPRKTLDPREETL